jgi:hypothetical protein
MVLSQCIKCIKRRAARTTTLTPARPVTGGAVAMAAVRRSNRPVQRLVGLPLLLALAAAVSGYVYERASDHYGDQQRAGRFTRAQAGRRACDLVARVSGMPKAHEAVSIDAYTTPVTTKRGVIPGGDEWDVLCRPAVPTGVGGDGGNAYFLRIDADSGEPLLVRKERDAGEWDVAGDAEPAPQPARDGENEGSGDLRRPGPNVISRRQASLWARRYLRLVGLPLPKDAHLVQDRGYDFTYCCGAPNGTRRMLRVRVSPKDGSLEHLMNGTCRAFPPLRESEANEPRGRRAVGEGRAAPGASGASAEDVDGKSAAGADEIERSGPMQPRRGVYLVAVVLETLVDLVHPLLALLNEPDVECLRVLDLHGPR